MRASRVHLAPIIIVIIVFSVSILDAARGGPAGGSDALEEAAASAALWSNVVDPMVLASAWLAWDKWSTVASQDFNTYPGLELWERVAGAYWVAPLSEGQALSPRLSLWSLYQPRWALALDTSEGWTILSRRWPAGEAPGLRFATQALVAGAGGGGPIPVQPGVVYVMGHRGALAAAGPLGYDTVLPHLARGEAWILAPSTGELRIYTPTGGRVEVLGLYKAPGRVYIVDGAPVEVLAQRPVQARSAIGGPIDQLVEERDGSHAPIMPGNPVVVHLPGPGYLLLDLAPGVSRVPTLLEAYRYTGDGWDRITGVWLVPAPGRVGIPVDPGGLGVVMVRAYSTIRVDRISWAPVDGVRPLEPGALEPIPHEATDHGVYTLASYPGSGGEVLAHVRALLEPGEVEYLAGAHVSIYGRLRIVGEAPSGPGWAAAWSDVVELPPGARPVEVRVMGYSVDGGPDHVLVWGFTTLLYPVVVASGFPESSIDYSRHTEAVIGISRVAPDEGVDGVYGIRVDLSLAALRTTARGEMVPIHPGVGQLVVRYGSLHECGSRMPSDVGMWHPSWIIYEGAAGDPPIGGLGLIQTLGYYSQTGSGVLEPRMGWLEGHTLALSEGIVRGRVVEYSSGVGREEWGLDGCSTFSYELVSITPGFYSSNLIGIVARLHSYILVGEGERLAFTINKPGPLIADEDYIVVVYTFSGGERLIGTHPQH